MAVEVDVYGSCVCRDIFRYAQPGKYKIKKLAGYVPITSLYEKPFQGDLKTVLDQSHMSNFEKLMVKVQASRNLPKSLLKNRADILVLDLADEFMERWEIENMPFSPLAVIEEREEEYEKMLAAASYKIKRKYSLLDMNLEEVEAKIKRFAEEILYSENNPGGYKEKNIIVVESLYTPDIMGNDGNIHKHDSKYKLHEYNEWLRKVYLIFYKYFQECKVIKLPGFIHSTQNHIRGVHPLHYMQDVYFYFERALDVLCGYSNINTIENLCKEESLKNRLNTRVAQSNNIYQIAGLLKRVDALEKREESKGIDVDIFGSCICRDIFRFTFPGRYRIQQNIERIPISCLYQEKIDEKIEFKNYEERMLATLLNGEAIKTLKGSNSKILIIDVAEERLDRVEIEFDKKRLKVTKWPKVENLFGELQKKYGNRFKIIRKIPYNEITEAELRVKYKKFVNDIVRSEANKEGFAEENIYIIESYYADRIIDNKGIIREYKENYAVQEHNDWFRKLYGILHEYLPKSRYIRLPQYVYASTNHMWGGHPLHYTDSTYYYLAEVIDYLTNSSQINRPENIYKEESLRNLLYTRLLNLKDK